ncbi:HEAT repeat domain-containing protein, partial [Escherichia coli]|uniref:HEAT repeat domain-containing protein n=1 Tax=Escherichia coli TaxID=562 RepID=UPI001FCEE4C3
SLKTSIKTITYLSDIGCLEIQGASLMSMPPAIANTFLFEMMKSKSKDVTLAAIYALGEGRCQAENITRELHRLSQSDDMEIKIAAIKALGRIYR